MNSIDPWLWLVPVAGFALFFLGWWAVSLWPTIRLERARELLRLQKEHLPELFLDAVRKSGKPRGLLWQSCDFTGEFVLARERESKVLHAIVPIRVQFQAVPESDMTENPNVEHPREGCAVFVFENGHWVTHGKTIFNLDTNQALDQFSSRYEPMAL